jgi:hypothetical protein
VLVNTVRAEDAAVTRQGHSTAAQGAPNKVEGRLLDLGRQHKTAEALYLALKAAAA